MLFGVDVFYEIKLPNIFLFVHPLGTVIGRGEFNDYLVVYQGCSIGANKDVYPILGKYVTLHPNASILGNCKIGNNCELASNSLIIDKDLDAETIYFGNPKNSYKKKKTHINNIWDV
jgi:serine O-acetyltransferase